MLDGYEFRPNLKCDFCGNNLGNSVAYEKKEGSFSNIYHYHCSKCGKIFYTSYESEDEKRINVESIKHINIALTMLVVFFFYRLMA